MHIEIYIHVYIHMLIYNYTYRVIRALFTTNTQGSCASVGSVHLTTCSVMYYPEQLLIKSTVPALGKSLLSC